MSLFLSSYREDDPSVLQDDPSVLFGAFWDTKQDALAGFNLPQVRCTTMHHGRVGPRHALWATPWPILGDPMSFHGASM